MNGIAQDLRYALRQLGKNPGFTAIAILTLALGIGANTALFSVVNGVLLNPLPYPHADRLVTVAEKSREFAESSIAYPNFLDWARDNHTFKQIAVYRRDDFTLTGAGEAQRVKAVEVTDGFFSVLGINPVLGRNFLPQENIKGAGPTVMLSGAFWKKKFGGSPDILGKSLILDGTAYTVIGVVPENFYFCCEEENFRPGDVYVPLAITKVVGLYDRSFHMGVRGVGRMKDGVTVQQARADLESIARNLAIAYPDTNKTSGIFVASLKERMVQDVRPMLLVLLAAVGFVLLIACGNVANLLLARSTTRQREFAIRAALGASWSRVVRQLLTESIVLAIAGGGLGLLLAAWGTKAGLAVLPGDLPRAHDLGLDPHVLLFTAAISILAAAFFGFVPALKSSRPDLQDTLKEGGRGGSAARHRTLGIFVVTQMALAVVLLIGAGLTVRSLVRLWNVNLGFDPSNILSFNVALPSQTAKQTPEQIRASLVHLRDEIAAIAGVKAAAIDYGARPMRGDNEWPFWIEGRPKPPTQSEMQSALVYVVGPEYAKVMGIPLERGRFLTQQDGAHSLPVAVVDQDFAREQFGNQDPIGQQIDFGFDVMGKAQIVGVVGHINQWGPARDATGPVKMQIYVPAMQMPDQYAPELANDEAIVVRTETPTHASIDSIRNAVARMNNEQVAYDFESMNETVARSIAERRFTMILLSAFAGIALLLASIGIYGVISYITGSRTREIGTRLALGAQRADVLKLVIAQGTKMALIGVAIGAVVALGLTRLMASLLFEVTAHDPVTFAGVALLLLVVALLACYLPARRAAKVDPMTALRYE